MIEIEKKGALFFGLNESKKTAGGASLPKIDQKLELSERLQDLLFNKRDEGYYFRKFHREKSLEKAAATTSISPESKLQGKKKPDKEKELTA
jgi:hypothetical protein